MCVRCGDARTDHAVAMTLQVRSAAAPSLCRSPHGRAHVCSSARRPTRTGHAREAARAPACLQRRAYPAAVPAVEGWRKRLPFNTWRWCSHAQFAAKAEAAAKEPLPRPALAAVAVATPHTSVVSGAAGTPGTGVGVIRVNPAAPSLKRQRPHTSLANATAAADIRASSRGAATGTGAVPLRGVRTLHASGAGLRAIAVPALLPGEGNVHTGATPPWLMNDSDDDGAAMTSPKVAAGSGGGFIGPSARPSAMDAVKARTVNPRKLRAADVGVVRGQVASDDWLPNFGRVWQVSVTCCCVQPRGAHRNFVGG